MRICILEFMPTLSLCIRNCCVHWASGTYACIEHKHQVLMRARANASSNMLSISSDALMFALSLRMRTNESLRIRI
jgi:hypothetical protein